MATKIFALDSTDKWTHVYVISDLQNVGAMPAAGEFLGVDGTRYTLSADGSKLTGNGTDLTLNARLDKVLDALGATLDQRLDRQQLSPSQRAQRKALALGVLQQVRNAAGPEARFDAMNGNQFGHATTGTGFQPVAAVTPGGWLHNLFCH